MLNVKKLIQIGLSLLLCLLLHISYLTFESISYENAKSNVNLLIENRIAKDLSRLPLPDERKGIVGNRDTIEHYINQLNNALDGNELDATLISIQSVKVTMPEIAQIIEGHFDTPSKRIVYKIAIKQRKWPTLYSVFAFVLSVVFYLALLNRDNLRTEQTVRVNNPTETEVTRLVIDLENKVLINSRTHIAVPLANKPLCFYTALIEFCIAHPDILLNQNKELPSELITLANKYFLRLTELGHTIRKRPNFSNSLEKTLSEIRAALDEIFVDDVELKALLFPPKAHGEGSRSKLHHYGLKLQNMELVEIIGK